MSIKHWPENERPREKLLQKGVSALSDAELLAILLRIGTQGMSAVDLARSLISTFGSLSAVMNASHQQLRQHKGMGIAAYAQFATVLEIGRRVLNSELQQKPIFDQPETLGQYLRLLIGHEPIEVAIVVFLNNRNQVITTSEMARGTVNENTVYIREIAKQALQYQATSIVFAHNHPSGSLNPSQADKVFTDKLKQALNLIDIILLDHFIITSQQVVSFKASGWL